MRVIISHHFPLAQQGVADSNPDMPYSVQDVKTHSQVSLEASQSYSSLSFATKHRTRIASQSSLDLVFVCPSHL